MSKPKHKPKLGRPSVETKVATTSISLHPTALARLAERAAHERVSRSHLIVEALREKFPSVFAGL